MTKQPYRWLLAAATLAGATPAHGQSAPATAEAPAAQRPADPRFRGLPRIDLGGGWSLKPFGRLQYDVGHVSRPGGLADPRLGGSDEIRRARLGLEGDIPGGIGFKLELDFADNQVEITDATLSYDASDALKLTIGQHNNFQSLEELTSSRFSTFMERAAFTDAFNFERRLGLSATFAEGDLVAQAGIFTDNIEDDANDALSLDGRIVYAPDLGGTRLHLGASAHWRDTSDRAALGATARYRQRPQLHSTDIRFVATPALPVESESSFGLEAAAIRGPFHAVGEFHWLEADTLVPGLSPTFFGGYGEIGWFITGESRGYRGGRFDRTRVRRPIEAGGIGAFQVALRYDRLDLNSEGVTGGTQDGLIASLTWIPTDHVRLLINAGRLHYEDAAVPAPGGDRDYSVTVVGARAQIDF